MTGDPVADIAAADIPAAKRALRATLASNRRAASGRAGTASVGRAIASVLDDALRAQLLPLPRLAAGYLPVAGEPDTHPLLERLAAQGVALIVPVLTANSELDWVSYRPGEAVTPGLRGTFAPGGTRLGTAAATAADLLIVPALAVDRAGHRLGRGGGSYDRTLAQLPAGRVVLAVVHDDEVLDEVPHEPHDQRVAGALTPGGLRWFAPPPPGTPA